MNLAPSFEKQIEEQFNNLLFRTSVTGNYEHLNVMFRTHRREYREMLNLIDLVNKKIVDGTLSKDNYISNFLEEVEAFDDYLNKLSMVHALSNPTKSDVNKIMHGVMTGRIDAKLKSHFNEALSKVMTGTNIYEAFNVPQSYGYHSGDPETLSKKDYNRLRKMIDYIIDGGFKYTRARTKIIDADLQQYQNTMFKGVSRNIVDKKTLNKHFDLFGWYVFNDWCYDKLMSNDKEIDEITHRQIYDLFEVDMPHVLEITDAPANHPVNWKSLSVKADVIRSS